jgi:hypothetical protein|tara:strand:- start:4451 stop:4642 length:192 start_codon:yes stop_codon:yes gene_type:complete
MAFIFGQDIPIEFSDIASYVNLLDVGVVTGYTMSEIEARSRTWVENLYAYTQIREAVRAAQAA